MYRCYGKSIWLGSEGTWCLKDMENQKRYKSATKVFNMRVIAGWASSINFCNKEQKCLMKKITDQCSIQISHNTRIFQNVAKGYIQGPQ